MDRTGRKKIKNKTEGLNKTINQLALTNTYCILHPITGDYTFFSSAHGMFSRIDHIIVHKTIVRKFKKPEIISDIFSEHNGMKLKIDSRRKAEILQICGN